MNSANYHVIKDPVHGTMQWTHAEDAWIKPFIDSKSLQRLRHIKQLGMSDFIFPGAVHTRFNHSLGCCYLASQIANKIGLPLEEKQLVILACLLHDIGHGPFSHTFEEIFKNKSLRHEAWTPFFLAEYHTASFLNAFNERKIEHPLTPQKLKCIEDMIMHRPPRNLLLADIVSSQLDADRLDYLLRDSHFCGVSYGQFDLRWMLNSLVIINTEKGRRLGVTHKGTGVVEHYLMARRLMIRNIYLHQKKLAFEFFLIKLLNYLAEVLEQDKRFEQITNTALGKFLINANQFNNQVTAENKASLQRTFIEANYDIYKELTDYDIIYLIKCLITLHIKHPVTELAERLQYRHMPKIVRLDAKMAAHAESMLDHLKKTYRNEVADWQIALIKTPHQSYTPFEDAILILTDNKVYPINEISLIMEAISNQSEEVNFLCIDKVIYENPKIQNIIRELLTK